MEVIPSRAGGSGSTPFQRHNVEEWSRLDRLTGMLEHARVETDHWAANTSNTSHKYGKVVDSRARNLADGSVQQRQRKQLEVFQAQVPGGSLQVIRTQSVTSTSSSSSSWRAAHNDTNPTTDFENLQLALNHLDLSSQKTKASVGRSGSIGSRRPPSRPRSIISKVDNAISEEDAHNAEKQNRLSEVSRICHQVHEEAKKNLSNSHPSATTSPFFNLSSVNDDNDMVVKREDANKKDCSNDNKYSYLNVRPDKRNSLNAFDTFCTENARRTDENLSNGLVHALLTRKKSCSTEDLQNDDNPDNDKLKEGNEMLSDWKRTSKVRRSLQFPSKGNNLDLIPNGNVSKLRKELEVGKKLDSIRNNTSNFEALENIFRHGTDSAMKASLLNPNNRQTCSINSLTEKPGNEYELEGFSRKVDSNKNSPHKRHSFVTVESLKEVRGRLRRLSTPPLDDIQHSNNKSQTQDIEESDDGIVTEEPSSNTAPEMDLDSTEGVSTSRVKSYVYGMEAMVKNRSKPAVGTGSLESRTSNRSSNSSGSRSEEWYNRRKSYGFEQVHNQQNDNRPETMTFQEKGRVESSTDSGICRSSETVTPSWTPLSFMSNRTKENDQSSYENMKINHSIHIKNHSHEREPESRSNESTSQKGRRTVVTLGSDSESKTINMKEMSPIAISNSWRTGFDNKFNHKVANNIIKNVSAKSTRRLSEPVTVTIPVVPDNSFKSIDGSDSVDSKRLYFRQLSEGEHGWKKRGSDPSQKNLSDETKSLAARHELLLKQNPAQNGGSYTMSGANSWSHPAKIDNEVKRHSIAVDETKYVREGLKSYNLHDKRMGHFNFEKEFKPTPANILDFDKNNDLNIARKEEPLHREMEYKVATSLGISQDNGDPRPASFVFEDEDAEEFSLQHHLAGKKHKKVEFCKTEVHFAAEPGRFNIVETDEKPPPNTMFRRRRRNSSIGTVTASQTQEVNKTSLPEIRFGDSPYEKKLLGGTEPNSAIYQTGVNLDNCNKNHLDQTQSIVPITISPTGFQDDADKEDNIFTQANATILSPMRQDIIEMEIHNANEEVCEDLILSQQNTVSSNSPNNTRPRSILKNSRKPRSFHLGDMDEGILVSSSCDKSNIDPETKWGVRLRPIQNKELPATSTSMWRSTVTLQNKTFEEQKQQNYTPSLTPHDEKLASQGSFEEGTDLKKLLKSLRPAFERKSTNDDFIVPLGGKNQSPDHVNNGMEIKISSAPPTQQPMWSVAERVRQVEDMKQAAMETRGYSTRVNFGAGETTVIESGSSDDQQGVGQKQSLSASSIYQPNNRPKPIWLRREERKQEEMTNCDMKRQTASETGLFVRIGKNEGIFSIDGHVSRTKPEKCEDINSNNVTKTTKILIDLSPSASDNHITKMGLLQNNVQKKSTGTLRSPSLIMKTINQSSVVQEQGKDEKEHLKKKIQSDKRNISNGVGRQNEGDVVPVATPRTKKLQKPKNMIGSDLSVKTEEKNRNNLLLKKNCMNTQIGENEVIVPSQLAALKELYYSADLSDDSERADEEVRSYMSGGGDEDERDQDEEASSVVSGSWSRMRAFRNIQHHFHKIGTRHRTQPHKDYADGSPMTKFENTKDPSYQRSVATAKLQSYNDSGRLRSVETLVSTRSGHPKITSISLRYEGEQSPEDFDRSLDSNASSLTRYQSSFHSLPPSKINNLHITEPVLSSVYPENTSSTPVSLKSYNKPLQTQQRGNSNSGFKSNKTLFTQKQNEGSSTFTKTPFQTEFTTKERNYENVKPRSPARKNSDSCGSDQNVSSSVGRKSFHPKHEDKSTSYENETKFDLSLKLSERQEPTEPTISSDRRTNNGRSLSPVYKEQGKSTLSSSVSTRQQKPSSSSISSDFSHRRNRADLKKKEFSTIEGETKKGSNFNVKSLTNGKYKHLDGIFTDESNEKNSESEETIKTDVQHIGKEKRSSKIKSNSSVSSNREILPSPSESIVQTGILDRKMTNSSLYENVKMLATDSIMKSNGDNSIADPVETESAILEELTQAADQILQVVNGYTDEESYRASSDEDDDETVIDGRRRRGKRCGQVRKPSANLGTISEAPSSKKQQDTGNGSLVLRSQKNNGISRKNQRLTKTRIGPTSSTSSVESFTREISRASAAHTRSISKHECSNNTGENVKSKPTSSSTSSTIVKPGSRTARLLQRASSRELLLQTYASSSEDVASGVEGSNHRKPTVPRRTRTHNSSTNKTDQAKTNLKKPAASSDSQPSPLTKTRSRKRDVDVTRPKERYSGSTNKMGLTARKSSGGDSGDKYRLRTSRTREEEGRQRSSGHLSARRDNADLRHRAQEGMIPIVESNSRDKNERTTVYERRVMGTGGGVGWSSTSCVVTKKKPSLGSSHTKGLLQTKAMK